VVTAGRRAGRRWPFRHPQRGRDLPVPASP